jgi:hypothetical protein
MTTSAALAGGDWKNSPLHQWFEGLSSKIGMCCSNADGLTLTDVEWDVKGGHYRVFLEGQWIDVPDEAIVVDHNRFGQAVVWPYSRILPKDGQEQPVIRIRCFMPGIEA